MYEFLRIQFLLGRIDAAQVLAFAPRFLTEEEAQRIVTGGDDHGTA